MPKTCDNCERGPLKGNIRSHSNQATRRWQKVNLQRKTIDGEIKTLCTKCLKTLSKNPAK